MKRSNLVYVADNNEQFACRNISANSVHFGFKTDLKELKSAAPKPKGLKFRKVYATAISSTGIKIDRCYNVGDYQEEIYMRGGIIKQKVMIKDVLEELVFTVTAAKGESRKFLTTGDPGGPAPLPIITLTAVT